MIDGYPSKYPVKKVDTRPEDRINNVVFIGDIPKCGVCMGRNQTQCKYYEPVGKCTPECYYYELLPVCEAGERRGQFYLCLGERHSCGNRIAVENAYWAIHHGVRSRKDRHIRRLRNYPSGRFGV